METDEVRQRLAANEPLRQIEDNLDRRENEKYKWDWSFSWRWKIEWLGWQKCLWLSVQLDFQHKVFGVVIFGLYVAYGRMSHLSCTTTIMIGANDAEGKQAESQTSIPP